MKTKTVRFLTNHDREFEIQVPANYKAVSCEAAANDYLWDNSEWPDEVIIKRLRG